MQVDTKCSQAKLIELAESVTKEGVEKFLHDIKLGDYAQLFKENDVDGSILFSLQEGDLEDLGITNGFHRKKIIKKFEGYVKSLSDKIWNIVTNMNS